MIYVVKEYNEWYDHTFADTRLFTKLEDAEAFYARLTTYNVSKCLSSFENDFYTIIKSEAK